MRYELEFIYKGLQFFLGYLEVLTILLLAIINGPKHKQMLIIAQNRIFNT